MGRTRRVTLREAADLLDISKDAVRKRISRGTLPSDMGEDGRRYVYLDIGEDADLHTNLNEVDRRDALIAELRAEVEAWREEARRKDHLLAAALDRIPAVEAPEEASEAPESATQEREGVETPLEAQRRSWWRRFFAGG